MGGSGVPESRGERAESTDEVSGRDQRGVYHLEMGEGERGPMELGSASESRRSFKLNNAAAAIMIPFACGIGTRMGIDPRAIIMTVVFGASAAFATPIGYQTNMFIYGPGGYRFRDFLIIGIPLNLLLAGMSVVLIPYFWPLH